MGYKCLFVPDAERRQSLVMQTYRGSRQLRYIEVCWHDGEFFESNEYPRLEIMDRVGGGDSFASGLVYGFLEHNDPGKAVNYGAAHGALAMTTPGDTTMASLGEVEKIMSGGGARVVR